MSYTTFTIPDAALTMPLLRNAVADPEIEMDLRDDGTVKLMGSLDAGARYDIENALEAARFPFDRFRVDEGTGDDDTGDRRMFRPAATDDAASEDVILSVSAHDDVLFFLEDWDRVATTPGGAITRAQVEQFLGLTVPPLAAWLRDHPVTP